VRDARRQGGDDRLVEAAARGDVADDDERVGVAHEAVDVAARRRLLEQRDRQLRGERGLLGVRSQYGRGTSSVNSQGSLAARRRTSSSSRGVPAVR
jgi:hypothetical protein